MAMATPLVGGKADLEMAPHRQQAGGSAMETGVGWWQTDPGRRKVAAAGAGDVADGSGEQASSSELFMPTVALFMHTIAIFYTHH